MTSELPSIASIVDARVLLNLGDSVTTDHISPAGSIARNSPAAKFLTENGYANIVTLHSIYLHQHGMLSLLKPLVSHFLCICRVIPKDFNSYGARRGNDAVMSRGTFANIRLVNKFLSKPGSRTIHVPSGEEVEDINMS